MNGFFVDFFLFSVVTIIITAFFGNVIQLPGKIFRKKEDRHEFVNEMAQIQKNWKRVGGKKKTPHP